MRYKALPPSLRGAPRPERPPLRARQTTRRRVRDWLATIPIMLLLPALVLVSSRTDATQAILDLPATAQPGEIVSVHGTGFPHRTSVQLGWDGSMAGLPILTTDVHGTFHVALVVPTTASPGSHRVAVTFVKRGNPGNAGNGPAQGGELLAEATIEVVVPAATVTPPPIAATPVATATAVPATPGLPGTTPTTAPVPVSPAPTPHVTPAPTPVATAAPTPTSDAHDTPDPLACTGYPEPRVFLEVQEWWQGDPVQPGQVAHVHAGTCFPLGQQIGGRVAFDVRIVMHNNPGHLFSYETALFADGHGSGDVAKTGLDHRCATTCTFWVRSVVETSNANDGWHEFRFKARVRMSNGAVMLTSSGWPAYVRNGNVVDGSRSAMGPIVGRGWYEHEGYQNAVLRDTEDVLGVVSGAVTLTLRLDKGADGGNTTFSAAYVDPDFHHGHHGQPLIESAGPFRGDVTIDTRTLSNGVHRLVLRVDSTGSVGTNSGIQVITFAVRN